MVKGPSKDIPEPLLSLRVDAEDRRIEEYQRLFYVAATRAEEHLVICGGKEGDGPTWHQMVMSGFRRLSEEVEVLEREAGWGGQILRYAEEKPIEPCQKVQDVAPSISSVPSWINEVAVTEEANPVVYPSLLTDTEDDVRGAARLVDDAHGDPKARGLLIHHLLEVLPDHPREGRRDLAQRVAASTVGLEPSGIDHAIKSAMGLVEDPQFADLFGPGSRAEVSIQGQIDGKTFSGQIDRLLVRENSLVAVEYKTSRWIPRTVDDVPVAHRRQLLTYLDLLRTMQPGADVQGLLIYTAGPVTFAIS